VLSNVDIGGGTGGRTDWAGGRGVIGGVRSGVEELVTEDVFGNHDRSDPKKGAVFGKKNTNEGGKIPTNLVLPWQNPKPARMLENQRTAGIWYHPGENVRKRKP